MSVLRDLRNEPEFLFPCQGVAVRGNDTIQLLKDELDGGKRGMLLDPSE